MGRIILRCGTVKGCPSAEATRDTLCSVKLAYLKNPSNSKSSVTGMTRIRCRWRWLQSSRSNKRPLE